MVPSREVNSFECSVCSATMESWTTAWVPTYRLLRVLLGSNRDR
jgi:hypothetical protein